MRWNRTAVLAALGAVVAAASVAATCGSTTTRVETTGNDAQSGITVTGQGKVSGKPDLARVTLGVSTLADTVEAARDEAATSLDAMVGSMRSNGVASGDLQTQQFSISPEYDYSNNRQTLKGFRVTNTVTAKLRDINKTGQIIDAAVAAGGDNTQVQGIVFTIDKPAELQDAARKAAIADARAKAETLAKEAGVGLGGPVVISEGGGVPPPLLYAGDSASAPRSAAGANTPIEPGELDVTIDVSVRWAIQ